MNSSSLNETSWQKIIIPKGSIHPNETVIIEIPTESRDNRSFVASRETPRYYSSSPKPPARTPFSTRANSLQYKTDPQTNYYGQSSSTRGRPIYQTHNYLDLTKHLDPPSSQNVMDYTLFGNSNDYETHLQDINMPGNNSDFNMRRFPIKDNSYNAHYVFVDNIPEFLRNPNNATPGFVNSTYGATNKTDKKFSPGYTSTPISKFNGIPTEQEHYINNINKVTPPYTQNVNTRSLPMESTSAYDTSSSSSSHIDDPLMEGDVGRVAELRAYPTFNIGNTSKKSPFYTSPLAPKSNNYSTKRMEGVFKSNAENKVHPTFNKIDLGNTYNRNVSGRRRGLLDYSIFAPPVTSTPNKSNFGNFSYSNSIPNQTFTINKTGNYPSKDGTTYSDSSLVSNYIPSTQNSTSHNVTYDISDTSSGMSNSASTNTDLRNAHNLTCSSYTAVPNAKRVTFEKSTTSVETYTVENENLEDRKKTSSTSVTTVTKETTTFDNPRSTLNTTTSKTFLNKAAPTSTETPISPSVNFSELEEIEARERDQLGYDLRRWQEARRKLAISTSKFTTTGF